MDGRGVPLSLVVTGANVNDGKRLDEVLERIEMLFSPELLIFGGGISKEWERFGYLLKTRAPIVPAETRNEAGIIGAALATAERQPSAAR